MLLAQKNPHPRDSNIQFFEEGHEYKIVGFDKKPTSVTTLIHHYFPEFDADVIIDKMMSSKNWPNSKYFGKTKEQIKEEWDKNRDEAAKQGTIMHKGIENFFNEEPVENRDSKEFQMFLNFWNDMMAQYPTLKIYRTEWLVYDESIGLAGSIDCVLEDDKGNLYILDWKRSKEIKTENKFDKGKAPFDNYDHCNYWHYSLQLNFYRHILQTKYNKKVVFMMLVVLHPNQSSYSCHSVLDIDLTSVWSTLN